MIVTERRGVANASDWNGVLRVVTWNIQFGIEVDAAATELTDNVDLAAADIVLVQEMDEHGTARLADLLHLDYVYAALGTHRQSGRNFGNAVLSRWQLGEPTAVRLPHKSAVQGQERVLVHSDVRVAGRVIGVGSVHTEVPSMSSAKRRRQFGQVAASFAAATDVPFIVGGDFNTLTRRGIKAVAERMAAVGASRVTDGAGPTLRRTGQEFTLDHIFARGLAPVAAGVAPSSPASDHRALWAVLRFSEEPGSDSKAV